MSTDKKQESETADSVSKPDPGTENTTDPQEHMEGPISSLVKKTGDQIEKKGDQTASEE